MRSQGRSRGFRGCNSRGLHGFGVARGDPGVFQGILECFMSVPGMFQEFARGSGAVPMAWFSEVHGHSTRFRSRWLKGLFGHHYPHGT